ncbi:GNAT family acetyltransferase [Corynebacterium endometrii]|uniref:GNAT family acetyltransferase n=1 Tax=Corynebacterium endometrii TaxID=2488819 RepID=UPI001FEC7BFA|nr:GNAT family acetyltransferase [Corynebacterium endometrii]
MSISQPHLVQFESPSPGVVNAGGWEPSDAVRTFVFMANLAAQEASGDPAASSSPERVVHRLKGSTESRTLLFGVVDGPAPLGEVSELGLPLIATINSEHAYDFVSFIHLSLPLIEEKENADIECVLDVDYLPMPGEALDAEGLEVARWTVAAAERLAVQLGRSILQTGILHPAGTPATHDPLAAVFAEAGYEHKHTEHQLQLKIPDSPAVPMLTNDLSIEVWPDYDIPDSYIDQVLELLTVASVDSIQGELSTEPICWTRQRLNEAHGRLRDRKAHTLMVALINRANDTVLSLTELGRHAVADPQVSEWTITVTRRDSRKRGFATLAKLGALAAVPRYWPNVTKSYCSVAEKEPAMNAIYRHLGACGISTSSAWEKRINQC